MNISKLLLAGCVALSGTFLAPTAQARDHDRHDHHDRDYRDRHEFRHHHYRYGDYNRPYYYDRRRPVIYNEGYYTEPSSGVTIAIGGHRRDRHDKHDR